MDGIDWLDRKRKALGLEMDAHGRTVFLELVKDRVARNYDVMLLMTGERGDGKSTIARKYARAIDPDFTVEQQCCFSIEELMEVSETLRPGQAIIWDEPIEGNMKRSFQTKKNKMMEEFFTISRDRRLVTIILHMDPRDPDVAVRKYVKYWLWKKSRNWASMYVKGKANPFSRHDRPSWIRIYNEPTTKDNIEDEEAYDRKKSSARRSIADRYSGRKPGLAPIEDAEVQQVSRLFRQVREARERDELAASS